MKLKLLLFTFSMACAMLLQAQKFTDSLLLHVPTNSSLTDNGPLNIGSSNTGVGYTTDYRGLTGQAIAFNGTSDRVVFNSGSTALQHSLPMTASVWINISSTTGNYPVFYGSNIYTAYSGIWIQVIDGFVYANVGDGVSNGTGNRFTVKNSNKLTINTWYHLCVVFKSANSLDMYIDGVKDASATTSGGATSMGWVNFAGLSYGCVVKSGGYNYFSGKLDNLMIWGRALNDAEVKMTKDLIYFGELGNTMQDFGPTSTIPTKNGTTAGFDRLGKSNAGLEFNGVNDKLSFTASGNYKPTLPFTMSAWVYCTSKSGIMPIIATTDHMPNTYYGSTLWLENGYPTMYIGDGNCNGATCRVTYASADSVKMGQWNMVTAVVTSLSNIKMYINGKPVSGGSLTGTGSSMNNSVSIAGNIGFLTDAYSISNKYFKGNIDEVFVMNNAFTASEVLSLYASSVYVSQQPTAILAAPASAVSLNCKGQGTEKVAYQWQKMKWGTGWANETNKVQSNLDFPSLSASDTGYFRCIVSINGKTTNTNSVRVDMTAVNDVKSVSTHVSLYPNPANSSVEIKVGNSTILQIKIIDPQGKMVMQKVVNANTIHLDISGLSAGSYFILIETNDAILQENLQIQR